MRHAKNISAAFLLTLGIKECLWNLKAPLQFSRSFQNSRLAPRLLTGIIASSLPEHQVSAKPQAWDAVVCSPGIPGPNQVIGLNFSAWVLPGVPKHKIACSLCLAGFICWIRPLSILLSWGFVEMSLHLEKLRSGLSYVWSRIIKLVLNLFLTLNSWSHQAALPQRASHCHCVADFRILSLQPRLKSFQGEPGGFIQYQGVALALWHTGRHERLWGIARDGWVLEWFPNRW